MPRPKKTPTEGPDLRAAAVPRFASEDEERAFWLEHDTADHVDWSRARRVRLPALKPSTATISLRLPAGMLEELKVLANQRDVPYQSLLKVFLAERLAAERDRRRRAG
jgi:predicted DNA binding CopG/RHH family protein